MPNNKALIIYKKDKDEKMVSHSKKVMIIGLDGCTFDILNPLIEQGKLPNIASLISNGVSGKLRSTVPPVSAAAWTSFQTGNKPGKHGIFDFFRNCPENYSYTPVNSTFIKTQTFWEHLSNRGKSAGVVNFLFTYPPKKINGFIISGHQTPSESVDYTYPIELKEEILKFEPKYQVNPFKRIAQSKKFLRDVPDKLMIQERVNSYLINNYSMDLFMNMFAVPDIIQHHFWRHMDSTHPLYSDKEAQKYMPLIEKIFQTIDDIIGQRINNIKDDTNIIIMSDHGGCGVSKIVQINRWLQYKNLLNLKNESPTIKGRFFNKIWKQIMSLDRLFAKLDIWGLREQLKLATREKRMSFSKRMNIDWSKTKAYSGRIAEEGIFLNLRGREEQGIVNPDKEYEKIRDFLISNLQELKDPQSGNKIFKNVDRRENVYAGPYVHYAPDIILETADSMYQVSDNLLGENIFEDVKKLRITGKHHPEGILIAYGEGIKKGSSIQEAHISDLAPSILYMMGEKVPADMDGKVLVDLFEEHILQECPISYDKSSKSKSESKELKFNQDEARVIEDRLKDLGYL